MSGLVVMGRPCTFGATYHYQVTGAGELRLEGPIACPAAAITAGSVNGNALICRLDSALHCASKPAGAAAALDYSVDDNGVTAGGRTYRWTDPSPAAALLPQLRQQAATRKSE